jgi:hypothetical protein
MAALALAWAHVASAHAPTRRPWETGHVGSLQTDHEALVYDGCEGGGGGGVSTLQQRFGHAMSLMGSASGCSAMSTFCGAWDTAHSMTSYYEVLSAYDRMDRECDTDKRLKVMLPAANCPVVAAFSHTVSASMVLDMLENVNGTHERLLLGARTTNVSAIPACAADMRSSDLFFWASNPCRASVHASVWTLLGGNTMAPLSMWEAASALCAPHLNTMTFLDCLHGIGHAALHDALSTEALPQHHNCWYQLENSTTFTAQIVMDALSNLGAGAPTRGLAHFAASGLWMSYGSLTDAATPEQARSICTLGAARLDASDLFLPMCFRFASYKFKNTPVSLGSCLDEPMHDERARVACIWAAATLEASHDPQGLAFSTAETRNASLTMCNGLEHGASRDESDEAVSLSRRRLACLAGLTMEYGMQERQKLLPDGYATAKVRSTTTGEAPPMLSMQAWCELTSNGDERALCHENWQACSSAAGCANPNAMWALTTSVVFDAA